MDKLYIICVDDQREVLNSLIDDLEPYDELFEVEACESGSEVLELMDDIDANGDLVALIISDHVMPGMTGVELLSAIQSDGRYEGTKKLLLTGLATHEDTISAINRANLDMYIAKPWNEEDLHQKVSQLLTQYILSKGMDYTSYMDLLDKEVLFKGLSSM